MKKTRLDKKYIQIKRVNYLGYWHNTVYNLKIKDL